MADHQSNAHNDRLDVFGTKEVLRLTIEKMQSQILLFGLALIVVLVAGSSLIGKGGAMLLGSVMVVFGATLGSHVFLTIKRDMTNAAPAPEPPALEISNKNEGPESVEILHQIVNEHSSLALRLWVSHAKDQALEAASGGDNRSIKVLPISRNQVADDDSYRMGDRIQVHLQAGKNCYLTLLNVSSDGSLTVIYPNTLQTDNFVAAGRTLCIPGPADGFDFQLEGPPGTEQLKAIATLEPKTLLPEDFTDEGAVFRTAEPVPGARAIAVVSREINKLNTMQWDEATVAFEVEE